MSKNSFFKEIIIYMFFDINLIQDNNKNFCNKKRVILAII